MSEVNIDKINLGDEEELAKLFNWLMPYLHLWANQTLRRRREVNSELGSTWGDSDMDDFVSLSMIKVFDAVRRHKFQNEQQILAYGKLAVHSAIVDKYRQSDLAIQFDEELAPMEAEPTSISPEQEVDLKLLAETVESILQNSPDYSKQIFIKTFNENKRPREIADELNLPINIVYQEKQRILAKVRKKFSKASQNPEAQ